MTSRLHYQIMKIQKVVVIAAEQCTVFEDCAQQMDAIVGASQSALMWQNIDRLISRRRGGYIVVRCPKQAREQASSLVVIDIELHPRSIRCSCSRRNLFGLGRSL
jgi:hypothetical protein